MTKREKHLFIYTNALDNGDFETVTRILKLAESDAELERLILEINDALMDEIPMSYTPLITQNNNHNHQSEDLHMNISIPMYPQSKTHRPMLPLTLIAVAVITLVFTGVIYFQNQNTTAPLVLATTPQPPDNLTVFEQYIDAWETYDATLLEGIITEDHVLHLFVGGRLTQDFTGIGEMRELFNAFITGTFTDGTQQYTIISTSDIGDPDQLWVTVTLTMDTKPVGDGMMLTPLDADQFESNFEFFVSFTDGQISEVWAFWDLLELLEQAGALNSVSAYPIETRNIQTVMSVVDEMWNAGNYENLANYYADPFTRVLPFTGESIEFALEEVDTTTEEIENLTLTIVSIMAQDNTVTLEFTATGIFTDVLEVGAGINPTGEEISWTGIIIYEFDDDGLIVEERHYWTFEEFTRAMYSVETDEE